MNSFEKVLIAVSIGALVVYFAGMIGDKVQESFEAYSMKVINALDATGAGNKK